MNMLDYPLNVFDTRLGGCAWLDSYDILSYVGIYNVFVHTWCAHVYLIVYNYTHLTSRQYNRQ